MALRFARRHTAPLGGGAFAAVLMAGVAFADVPNPLAAGRSGVPTPAAATSPHEDAAMLAARVAGQSLPTVVEAVVAGRAEYVQGIAARNAGQYAVAAAQFSRVAAGDDPLAPFAQWRQAQMLARAGYGEEASTTFAAMVAADALPAVTRTTGFVEAAEHLARAGRLAEALAVLDRVRLAPGATADTRASMLWAAARLRREANDAGWVGNAQEALATSGSFSGAVTAIDALLSERVGVPRTTAALAYYRVRRNEDATRLFQDALNDRNNPLNAAEAAQAWFYLGALRERAGSYGRAAEAYLRSFEIAPAGPLADDALYWRARMLGDGRDVVPQVLALDHMANAFPDASLARDARLRAAVETGRAGRLGEALARLEAITRTRTGEEAATAARWHAIFRSTPGAPAAPVISAETFAPASLAAILDRSGADAQQPLAPTALLETPGGEPTPAEALAAEEWVTQTFGADAATPTAEATRTQTLGFALAAVGEDTLARRVLSSAIAQQRQQPSALLHLSREAGRAGLYDIQQQAAVTMLSPLSGTQRLNAPKAILRLAYPAAYLEETVTAARRFGVPPLLLLALVRQESAFHPTAGSSAGAFGLAQMMPSTGAYVATELSIPQTEGYLGDPATSLTLGASYLGTQLRSFHGNVPAALSAYNAGPGNARRWQQSYAPANFDGLVWSTDFTETQHYMELVLQNYAWYRYIYAGSALAIR